MPSLRCSLFLLASVLAAGAQTLVDNDQVRILKVTDQPHSRNKPHEHKVNRVMIYLQSGRQEIVSNGKATVSELKANEVKWSPATTAPHTSEIVSDAPVTMIEIELKKPGDPSKKVASALEPLKVDPKHAHLEFENPQVRVYRVRLDPKGKLAMHEHLVNKIAIDLSEVDENVTTADGKTNHVTGHPGDASFSGPVKHREENLSDKPTDVIVVELKN
jgi:uncharacterized RmlC-like cupin family protein